MKIPQISIFPFWALQFCQTAYLALASCKRSTNANKYEARFMICDIFRLERTASKRPPMHPADLGGWNGIIFRLEKVISGPEKGPKLSCKMTQSFKLFISQSIPLLQPTYYYPLLTLMLRSSFICIISWTFFSVEKFLASCWWPKVKTIEIVSCPRESKWERWTETNSYLIIFTHPRQTSKVLLS